MKRINVLLFLTLLIGSCASPSASPAQLPTAAATQTVIPAETPHPTQTTVPTATPYLPLQTNGPYLLFTYDNKNFTILDADGSGRKQFQLPDDGYILQLSKSISPDGQWLAYFTGSIIEPYDIALNLLNLSTEATQKISNLIAPGFPKNLELVMESMLFTEGDECAQSMECRMTLLQRSFLNGIYSFDWAPNGQALAFAAQIDGPSSDLNIYDLETKAVRRITNDLPNIEKIDWAPNSKKIMYANSVPGSLYAGRTIHLADPKNQSIQTSPQLTEEDALWGEHDWLSENLYLFYEPNDTDPPVSHINILNTDTGQLTEVWPHTADFFVINRESKTILLMHKNHSYLKPTIAEGIYMVYPNGKYLKISDAGIFFVLTEGQKPYLIFAQDSNGLIYSISNNGSIDQLPWMNDTLPRISPDGKLLLFKENHNLALFTESYQPLKSWQMEDGLNQITWRPDSLGIFFSTESNIYYLGLPNGEIRSLLIDCSAARCADTRFVWLP